MSGKQYLQVMSALVVAMAVTLSSAADAAAQDTSIPTPESVFGFTVGAEGELFDYEESIEYFRRLEGASDMIRLMEVGTTSFGLPWTVAFISSAENLRNLDRYQEINQRLARPAGLTDAEAMALAREGRAFVDISGGLHASEIAGSQHTPLFAYDLLSRADDPEIQEILDNVILFLWPSINPDGQNIVVDWCRASEGVDDPPRMDLYQKYVGHDNNRDSYMLNMIESRVTARTWRVWEPHIIYVHHQTAPEPTRIWLPPFADPVGRYAPPIPAREISTIGMTIAQELDANGQPGAVHALATYDAWYPGYVDYMPVYQNIPAFWTETQGGRCATPKDDRQPEDFSQAYRALEPKTLYLSPWEGGPWTLRDAVDYMVTASRATLKYAAKFKVELLYNRYQAGRNTIQKYRNSAPYAYIIPQDQHDPVAPVELLRRMSFLGLRVMQLDRAVTQDGTTYPTGTWVIPMDQEFAELARELFEVQVYPDLGDDTPYDAGGWTLPFQMGVQVDAAQTPLSDQFRAALSSIEGDALDWDATPDAGFETDAQTAGIVPADGGIRGSGDQVLLDPSQNQSFRLMNRAIRAGGQVRFDPTSRASARVGQSEDFGAGRYVVSGVDRGQLDAWAEELWVRAEAVAEVPGAVEVPTRIGLYQGSRSDMDLGWTTWLFDTFEFNYTLITPEELLEGDLASRFDVIVFGSQRLGRGGGRGGRGGGGGGGGGDISPEKDPAPRVEEFVRAGGTALFWNAGATSAIEALGLPVENVVAGLPRDEYFAGISIMAADIDTSHPVTSGMPARTDVVVNRSPVFALPDDFDGSVLARYPTDGAVLRSGFLTGEEYMRGRAAALDANLGEGHVILIGFQPQWRGQPVGTFRMIFNAMFYAGARPMM
jgi:hypothetical protein